MNTEINIKKQERKMKHHAATSSSPVYAFGMIGALVYYLQRADTIQAGVLGFFKALAWPAILVYEILRLLSSSEKPQQ